MQSSKCECGTFRYGEDLEKANMSMPLVAGDLTADYINRAWHIIVQGYTFKNLTYEKDRLPVLSGLTKRFCQMKKGTDYLAELWRDNLARDLLWFIPKKAETEVVNTDLPSWSWASMNEAVEYYNVHESEKIAIEILQAECEWLGPDPTEEVRSDKIILKGMIEPLKSLSPCNRAVEIKLIITPFEEVSDDTSDYTIALNDKRCEKIDVNNY